MTKQDCISNRYIRIIATYLKNRLGHHDLLFEGLSFPKDRYQYPDDFFLNEDEWTTYENFQKVFRKAKDMSGEVYFYFNCGASSASLRSWGRYEYFARVFASPDDGLNRLPFFNKNFNDTKVLDIITPPSYDRSLGKICATIKVQYHADFDVEKDYISDPFRRGMISSIPTIWGLRPALITQRLYPYDPVILMNMEPEFARYHLNPKMEGNLLTIKGPTRDERRIVGRRILLEQDIVDGKKYYLGKYSEMPQNYHGNNEEKKEAILITDTVKSDDRIIIKEGEIYNAPYFILNVIYDRFSFIDRLSHAFRPRRIQSESGMPLIETINRLRETVKARDMAYQALEAVNWELTEAKTLLEDYNQTLEQKVAERTIELNHAKEELKAFNRNLKAKVADQVKELKRYDELRRYLSPKLTEKILSRGDFLNEGPKRKMMTVLFSDIRGFSTLTDNLEPEELFHLLDRYLSEMINLIHAYDGTLNKIIGDGMLIFFGDPISMDDHAQRAVQMALDMQKRVFVLRHEWNQYGYDLGVGIGINTGYMTVGNIGSDIHRDYTVIGNQVNVAARLESLAKAGQILVSQRTFSRVHDIIDAEHMGEIKVKGISTPVETYSIKVDSTLSGLGTASSAVSA